MKTKFTLFASTLIFSFGLNFIVKSQNAPSFYADSLQSILDHSLRNDFPNGGAIMEVYVPGKWKWSSATGFAISGTTNGQAQTQANANDYFRVGSITKMMIATCILKLQDQGLLNIEDPISNYLRSTLVNDTINSSATVKIRHLLNHTSGIDNSAANNACQADVLNNPLGYHSLEDAIYCGASQGEIFPPEFAWAYSNTNYSILAMIINNVSGMDYKDYLNQTIFSPLNLTHTSVPTTNQISQSHMGCYWNIGQWIDLTIINPSTYSGWADVVSTTDDLVKFYEGLRNGNIITPTSFALMQTMFPGTYDYGLGYDHYTISGVTYDGHYGEVANTSGLFFANTTSETAPNGYYIAYNFSTQGADMTNKIDAPVLALLNSTFNNTKTLVNNSNTKVYPNPSNDKLNITSSQKMDDISIINELGQVIYHINPNSSIYNIDLKNNNIEKGIYILKCNSKDSIYTEKIIVN